MKFEELSKKHQEFLMYCLFDYIKGKVKIKCTPCQGQSKKRGI